MDCVIWRLITQSTNSFKYLTYYSQRYLWNYKNYRGAARTYGGAGRSSP